MARWEYQESAEIPRGGGELQLFRREMAKAPDFAIRIKGEAGDLMNSRQHDSEDALGALPLQMLGPRPDLQVLIGGLGMGFTVAAVLQTLDELGSGAAEATVQVAELVPGVIDWNRRLIGDCASQPLNDQRVTVIQADVYREIEKAERSFDAIMLDVDNGPEALTHDHNNRLYNTDGLSRSMEALRPGGVLAVWSAGPERSFTARLQKVGFKVEERRVRAHAGKGARHVIWLATKPDRA